MSTAYAKLDLLSSLTPTAVAAVNTEVVYTLATRKFLAQIANKSLLNIFVASGNHPITTFILSQGFGTQNSAMSFGSDVTTSYAFNGQSWLTSSNLNNAPRSHSTSGVSTSGLKIGGRLSGSPSASVENFNGATWSNVTGLNVVRGDAPAAGGINASTWIVGGVNSGFTPLASSETYNGSSWTTQGSIGVARQNCHGSGSGTTTASLSVGGQNGSLIANCDKFNGSAWTSTQSLSAICSFCSVSGTQNNSIKIGGTNGTVALSLVERFNGNGWAAQSISSPILCEAPVRAGTANASFIAGGYDGVSNLNSTFKFYGEVGFDAAALFKSNTSEFFEFSNTSQVVTTAGYLSIDIVQNKNTGTTNQDKQDLISLARHLDPGAGTWSASGSLNTVRNDLSGCGTKSASIAVGGFTGSVSLTTVENFNGAVWSAGTNLGTVRFVHIQAGTQAAAWIAAGESTVGTFVSTSEKYNGVSWASSGSVNTQRGYSGGTGVFNAGIKVAGIDSSFTAALTDCEKFNGVTWSSTGSLSSARMGMGCMGSQNSCFAVNGGARGDGTGGITAGVEVFNGATWSSLGAAPPIPMARPGSSGSTSNALVSAGDTTNSNTQMANCQKYNGVWSMAASVSQARWELSGSGTANNGMAFGGRATGGTIVGTSENFLNDLSFMTTSVFSNNSVSSLASGSMTTARTNVAGLGIQSAAVAVNGANTGGTAQASSETYNGASWTISGSTSVARVGGAASGIKTAGLYAGGFGSPTTQTDLFNGATWATTGGLGTARGFFGACGTQAATVAGAGRDTGVYLQTVELFNGATWSSTANQISNRTSHVYSGLQNAAQAISGYSTNAPSTSITGMNAVTERFNGTSWFLSANVLIAVADSAANGSNANAFLAGGTQTTSVNTAGLTLQVAIGNTWSVAGNLLVDRGAAAAAGTLDAGLYFGGSPVASGEASANGYTSAEKVTTTLTTSTPVFANLLTT